MILIRVDIGGDHSLGHGQRMVAVAQELTHLGQDVAFLTRTPELPRWFRAQGYDWRVWCEPDHATEYGLLQHPLIGQANVFVIDRKDYYDSAYFRELRGQTKVVRIDHPEAEPETADLLVIPNMHQPPEVLDRLHEDFEERLLCGSDYVMVSEVVNKMTPVPYVRRNRTIVFFAGGSDPKHLLLDMYRATHDLRLDDCQKIFMFGRLSGKIEMDVPNYQSIVTGFDHQRLAMASMAVGPLSVTAYEAMRLGTPVLTFPGIPSDEPCMEALDNVTGGAVQTFMASGGDFRDALMERLRVLWHDRDARRWISHQTRQMIDGHGARRIAEAIVGLAG